MSEPFALWKRGVPLPAVERLPLPGRVEHRALYRGAPPYAFTHESEIASHDGSLFAAWHNSPVNECEPQAVIRWARSDDRGATWTEPRAITGPTGNEGRSWEGVHMRSKGDTLYAAESRDGGRRWEALRPSNLPAATSRTAAGRFSTGQRYLAFNLRTDGAVRKWRDALGIAVSAPGEELLSRVVVVRSGTSPAPRAEGRCKEPQWSYPAVAEQGGFVYVTYSVSKEDCWLSILPLSEFA